MKLFRLLFIFIILSNTLSAQVAGISASKLNAVCVDVVDHKKVEFEPGFYHSTSNDYWNRSSELNSSYDGKDSTNHISSMFMRVTYGLFDKLEVGLAAPVDMSAIDFGMRYVLYDKKKMGFAIIAGLNYPLGNQVVYKDRHTILNTAQVGMGAVVSYQQNENLSIDFNAGYGKYFSQDNIDYLTYISADAGYYFFKHQFQVVLGLGAKNFKHYKNEDNQFLLTMYPGITIETGERYIIVLTSPIDLYGQNIIRTFNLGFALTVTID